MSEPVLDDFYLVAADGGVFTLNLDLVPFQTELTFWGSMAGQPLNSPIVGISATTAGYWLVAADGGVFAFGNAPFYGSMGGSHLNAPIVGIAPSPGPIGGGYYLVAADGGVFGFGDAPFYGSMGGQHIDAPVVGMAAVSGLTASDGGYFLVAADGGVFAFGSANFSGSAKGLLANPVVGLTVQEYFPSVETGGGPPFSAVEVVDSGGNSVIV